MKSITTILSIAVAFGALTACGSGGETESKETCQRQDVSISIPEQQIEQDTACAMDVSSDLKLRFVDRGGDTCQPVLVAVTELRSPVSRININYTFDNQTLSGSGIGLRAYLLADRLSNHAIIGEFDAPQASCSEASLSMREVTCQTGEGESGSANNCGNVIFENTEIFQSFSPPPS